MAKDKFRKIQKRNFQLTSGRILITLVLQKSQNVLCNRFLINRVIQRDYIY